ncbi:MAG: hypothetical protein IT365_18075 [Candidatus Hydrogenedentes bacterium]|nr:hypothetical protein [Candidatus Hydrogenedentota bacterium]
MTEEASEDALIDKEPEQEASPVSSDSVQQQDEESTGDAALDKRLSEPVFQGIQGIDTAQIWISAFLIAVLGVIVYSGIFSSPFHYLDQVVVRDNPAAHRVATLPEALAVEPSAPLPMLTIALTWNLFGESPLPFHVVNVLLHVLNAVLLYLLCRRLLPAGTPEPIPMLAGLFMALHPLNTESVNYIVGRGPLMVTFFALLTLSLFSGAVRREDGLCHVRLGLSMLCMLLAWACDSSAALLPPLLLALDWVLHGPGIGKRLLVHAAYWAAMVVLIGASWAAQDSGPDFNTLVSEHPGVTSDDRADAFMTGMGLTASLAPQTLDHNMPAKTASSLLNQSMPAPVVAVNAAALLGVAVVLLLYRSFAGLGLLWYGASLAWGAYSITAEVPFSERLLYLPMAGIILVIPWLISKATGKKVPMISAGVAAAILLLAAASGTFLRNRVWANEEYLWQDAAEVHPESPLPQQRLGTIYYGRGMAALQQSAQLAQEKQGPAAAAQQEQAQQVFARAEEYLREAHELDPRDPQTSFLLGRTVALLRRPDEALPLFMDALRQDPANFDYTLQLATFLDGRASAAGGMNDRLAAIDYFKRAERLGDLSPDARTQFASSLAATGDLESAQRELALVAASYDYKPAKDQLAQVQATMKALAAMQARARQLLQQDPHSPEGLRLHAEQLVGSGMILQATYVLDQLLRKFPDDVNAWILMGMCRAIVNDHAHFVQEWPNAPASPPGQPSPWIDLARRCAANGRWDASRAYLEFAAGRTPEAALPLVALAEFALSFQAGALATQYLDEATKLYPESPRPWIMLCDIAVSSQNLNSAREYLAEAEERGADAQQVAERRAKIGEAPVQEQPDAFKSVLR